MKIIMSAGDIEICFCGYWKKVFLRNNCWFYRLNLN